MPFSDDLQHKDGYENKLFHYYQNELVSSRYAHPSTQIKERPVYICAHGFGASPFEWKEFKEFAELYSKALVSSVFLGGHHSVRSLRKSNWKDWATPILIEYNTLISLGFKHIILCGSSTSALLLLQLLHHGRFEYSERIKHLVLIDPLLYLQNKSLNYLPFLQYFISDPTVNLNKEESEHWLHIRPKEALLELRQLIISSKALLKNGLILPKTLSASIYHSKSDPVLDPKSSQEIYCSLKESKIKKSQIFLIDSHYHVFTRLAGRNTITATDIQTQRNVFNALLQLTTL
jgi:esterase/lipase